MTTPAHIVHRLEGRVRLRVSGHKRDSALFEQIRQRLGAVPGVVAVHTNELTGSVLVIHEGDFDAVVERARSEALLDIAAAPVAAERDRREIDEPPPWQSLFDEVINLDRRIKSESQDRWALGPMWAYGLLGACLLQISRGQYFPAASTLILQARGLLREANKGRQPAG